MRFVSSRTSLPAVLVDLGVGLVWVQGAATGRSFERCVRAGGFEASGEQRECVGFAASDRCDDCHAPSR